MTYNSRTGAVEQSRWIPGLASDGLLTDVPMLDREPGLRMIAANGTEIPNMSSKVIEFVGQEPGFFTRRA